MDKFQELHVINTRLLAELDRVCRLHGIKYYLDSGTLIGAVRHHGAIPWDDDVDVTMKRSDYERFVKEAVPDLSKGFQFICPSDFGENCFYDYVPHIAYVNSQVKDPNDPEMKYYKGLLNHILLDIFVLDEITDSAIGQKIHVTKMRCRYGLSWAYRYSMDKQKYSSLQKCGIKVLSAIGRHSTQSELREKYYRLGRKYDGRNTHFLYSPDYIFEEIGIVYPEAWFESTVDLDYEGHKFMGPVGYDKVLTSMFGDYMKLPPEEERVSKHFDPNNKFFITDIS
ncbi:MAG: LicD family protein [Lachnospiraceae bacterium]|jgi:lipopolysaccharide cholinephosphotransferase